MSTNPKPEEKIYAVIDLLGGTTFPSKPRIEESEASIVFFFGGQSFFYFKRFVIWHGECTMPELKKIVEDSYCGNNRI